MNHFGADEERASRVSQTVSTDSGEKFASTVQSIEQPGRHSVNLQLSRSMSHQVDRSLPVSHHLNLSPSHELAPCGKFCRGKWVPLHKLSMSRKVLYLPDRFCNIAYEPSVEHWLFKKTHTDVSSSKHQLRTLLLILLAMIEPSFLALNKYLVKVNCIYCAIKILCDYYEKTSNFPFALISGEIKKYRGFRFPRGSHLPQTNQTETAEQIAVLLNAIDIIDNIDPLHFRLSLHLMPYGWSVINDSSESSCIAFR